MNLTLQLKKIIKGEILTDPKTLKKYSHDTSIFEITPKIVIYPKNSQDIQNLIKFINNNNFKNVSLTARAGGTDMTGGPINDSIILDFTKHMNKFLTQKNLSAIVQPGLYYKNFESKTLKKNLFLPSYPASKSICCLGGMIANNAGGEKTPAHGKTDRYVKRLKVILFDGNEYEFKPLNPQQLQQKLKQNDFEGQIYNKIYNLIIKNQKTIQNSKPKIKKNSAGYYLWNVYNPQTKIFDLTQLFVGSQGTLGIITEAEIKLIKKKKHSRLIICFIKSTSDLNNLVNLVLSHSPESLETFDSNTLKLALKFLPEIAKKLNRSLFSLLWEFRREALLTLKTGIPKFTVLVELTENNSTALNTKISKINNTLTKNKITHLAMQTEQQGQKYWTIRRESFNLMRQKVKNKTAVAFIDDFAVAPEHLPEFWPRLEKILEKFSIHTTIFGHAGSGNFHIVPLMDLSKKSEREKIPKISNQVYDLVTKYNGTITAEHNDGLIRGPYLNKMFPPRTLSLFKQTKKIFDPKNIFNPDKKIQADINYAMKHIKNSNN